jgi:hypothetical protein
MIFSFLDSIPQVRVISDGNEAVCLNNCSYHYINPEKEIKIMEVNFNETLNILNITLDDILPNEIDSLEVILENGEILCSKNNPLINNLICEVGNLPFGIFKFKLLSNLGQISFRDIALSTFEVKMDILDIEIKNNVFNKI